MARNILATRGFPSLSPQIALTRSHGPADAHTASDTVSIGDQARPEDAAALLAADHTSGFRCRIRPSQSGLPQLHTGSSAPDGANHLLEAQAARVDGRSAPCAVLSRLACRVGPRRRSVPVALRTGPTVLRSHGD